jgi:Ca2+-binding RTX toxin-like protein
MDRSSGGGDDTLSGDGSEDAIFGGSGDDTFTGGAGADHAGRRSRPGCRVLRVLHTKASPCGFGPATGAAVRRRVTHSDRDRGCDRVDFGDTLVGDDPAPIASFGGAGADALWGNIGDDVRSSAGRAATRSTVRTGRLGQLRGLAKGVTVRLWAGDGNGGDAEGDTLRDRGLRRLRPCGHAGGRCCGKRWVGGDDALWGNAGDDTLEGGAGRTSCRGRTASIGPATSSPTAGVTVRLWNGSGQRRRCRGRHAVGDRERAGLRI